MKLLKQDSNHETEAVYESSQSLPNDPPWMENSDESDDDDWFYKSIKRYKQLCTYSTVCKATTIDVHAPSSRLVIAGERYSISNEKSPESQKKFEVAVYLLPEKLVVQCNDEKEGLLSGRDLSLLAGTALDTSVLKVAFLDSDRLIFVQENTVSLWSMIPGSDLLISVNTFSLEPQMLFKDGFIIDNRTVLLGFWKAGVKCITKMDCGPHDVVKSNAKDLEHIEVIGCPSNLMIENFVQFNENIICFLAASTSNTNKYWLFFEPIVNTTAITKVHCIGIIECAADEMVRKSASTDLFGWTKTLHNNKKGILGARISFEREIQPQNAEMSMLIYRQENLEQTEVGANNCSQNVHRDCGKLFINKTSVNEESILASAVQFLPWANTVTDKKVENEETVLFTDYSHNLILAIGTEIYLYNVTILRRQSNFNLDLDWKAKCHLLFCHDGHKSTILHALPYASTYPNLFFSADSNNKLHAWNWQCQNSVEHDK